jgi:phage shock protein A
VSAAEDPEKVLDQVVTEMQEDLIKMRQASAQVMASQKQMEAKFKQAQATADDWLKRAELAVSKGEDDLAREALKRRKAYQDQADGMKAQLEAQQKAVDQLIANTRVLEGKLAEAKSKKDTLKARAASARTSKQVQEMVGSLNTSNAVVAFDKMEEKVIAMEAESEAVGMLVAGDGLESKFAALEGGTVEDELAALKGGMLAGAKAPAAALPEGRPLKDAIDLELEELRKKARE